MVEVGDLRKFPRTTGDPRKVSRNNCFRQNLLPQVRQHRDDSFCIRCGQCYKNLSSLEELDLWLKIHTCKSSGTSDVRISLQQHRTED